MTGKQAQPIFPTAAETIPDGLRLLIAACRRDEPSAQRRLYDAYAPLVFGIIRRYTADDGVAQEIHSDAFYRIFTRLEQYRFEGAFEGWMRRIAVHAAADYFRKQRPPDTLLQESTEDTAIYHDAHGLSKLAYKELLALIHALPFMQRAVFNLFVFEQYTHKDIATALDISENNSRWHLNDARRRLKEKIIATNR